MNKEQELIDLIFSIAITIAHSDYFKNRPNKEKDRSSKEEKNMGNERCCWRERYYWHCKKHDQFGEKGFNCKCGYPVGGLILEDLEKILAEMEIPNSPQKNTTNVKIFNDYILFVKNCGNGHTEYIVAYRGEQIFHKYGNTDNYEYGLDSSKQIWINLMININHAWNRKMVTKKGKTKNNRNTNPDYKITVPSLKFLNLPKKPKGKLPWYYNRGFVYLKDEKTLRQWIIHDEAKSVKKVLESQGFSVKIYKKPELL